MNELQKKLKVNALFSSVSGFIMILLNHQIANIFGTTNNTIFWIVGIVLIYFAITIGYEITKQRRWAVLWIIIQDYTWVLGSLILIIFNPFQVTQIGNVIIGVIAVIVLYMGICQMMALNKMNLKKD